MDQFRCLPEDLPRELYRVHYPESQTTCSAEGFLASDTITVYNDIERDLFKAAVENQFTWGYRSPLPFIAVFSDRDHTENWACKEPWHGPSHRRGQWTLNKIDTAELCNTHIFKLSQLITALGVRIPDRAAQHAKGAFLCLHKIPARAINETRDEDYVRADRESRRFEEQYHILDAYSGSDYEAAENNFNDDMMKMIEGDWD
ncbi:hypothetical protein ACJZ2D_016044 [Fusarium nematophilum]